MSIHVIKVSDCVIYEYSYYNAVGIDVKTQIADKNFFNIKETF